MIFKKHSRIYSLNRYRLKVDLTMASELVYNKMVIVPPKKATKVSMGEPVRQFVKQKNAENPEGYIETVKELKELRKLALFHSSGQNKLNKLMSYCDELTAVESGLPVSDTQIKIQFKWNDAFDRGSLFGSSSLSSLVFLKLYLN